MTFQVTLWYSLLLVVFWWNPIQAQTAELNQLKSKIGQLEEMMDLMRTKEDLQRDRLTELRMITDQIAHQEKEIVKVIRSIAQDTAVSIQAIIEERRLARHHERRIDSLLAIKTATTAIHDSFAVAMAATQQERKILRSELRLLEDEYAQLEFNSVDKKWYQFSKRKQERSEGFQDKVLMKNVQIETSKKERSRPDSLNMAKARFYLARATREIDQKDYNFAKRLIQRSLKIYPDYVAAKMLLGELLATFGDWEKALKEFNEIVELDSSLPNVYYNRAHCYMKLQKQAAAHADYNKAIDLEPNYIMALTGRASLLLEWKEYEAAIEDYDKVLELNAIFAPAYLGRGVALLELGRFEEAIIDFNRDLSIQPDDHFAVFQRGLAKIYSNSFYEGCVDLLHAKEAGVPDAAAALRRYCD